MKFSMGDKVKYGLQTGKVIKTDPELVVKFRRNRLTSENVTFPADSDAYRWLKKV